MNGNVLGGGLLPSSRKTIVATFVVAMFLIGGFAVCFAGNSDASDGSGVDGGVKWIVEGTKLTIKPAQPSEITEGGYDPGDMKDYDTAVTEPPYKRGPWMEYCGNVTTIEIVNDGDYEITAIGESAFNDNSGFGPQYLTNVTKVILPDTLTSIGVSAFYNVGSTNGFTIDFPSSLNTIGNSAFEKSAIAGVITFEQGNLTLGEKAFGSCTNVNLKSIIFKSDDSDVGVSVGRSSFGSANVRYVYLSKSVTNIGDSAFSGATIDNITFESDMTIVVGNSVFGGRDDKKMFTPNGGSAMEFNQANYSSIIGHSYSLNNNNYSQTTESTITTAVSPSGSGTVTGGGTYANGGTIRLTAVANEGHTFVKWSDGDTNATRTVTVSSDATYTAEFSGGTSTATITVKASPSNGGTVTGGGSFAIDSNITIKAVANSGYHFVKWDDGNTDASRTVKVTGDKTYTAIFEADGAAQEKSFWETPGNIAGVAVLAIVSLLLVAFLVYFQVKK